MRGTSSTGFARSRGHRRELTNATRRLADYDPAFAETASLAHQLQAMSSENPSAQQKMPRAIDLCDRFADTRLFYDIYRDLSQAVHPSWGLVAAYLEFKAPEWTVRGMNARGAASQPGEMTRALAVSGLWALYLVAVCRFDRPNAADVLAMGEEAGLPVDLRASDQRPDLQPANLSY